MKGVEPKRLEQVNIYEHIQTLNGSIYSILNFYPTAKKKKNFSTKSCVYLLVFEQFYTPQNIAYHN